ncbi:hypothetical protein [Variovorax sp. 38R]|uniref:hypothetical protein n=1 Tax=Variovorax sp. 38R TaxID=2774875 RepID=UPI00177C1651|nr:hypothetical protein [Variovorax sp. 38R]QOF78003.1 hypothetical protein IG196_27395 [Variovorax sp. 38R]
MNRQQQLDQFSLALHRRAMAALHLDPAQRERARQTLARWRQQSGETRSDVLWNEWEQLLASDLEVLTRAALDDSEHGQLMRSVSPLGVLVSQAERMTLLQQAREEVAVP